MRKSITIVLMLLLTFNMVKGQEKELNKNKLKFRSVSTGFGVYRAEFTKKKRDKDGYFSHSGLAFTTVLSLSLGEHLLSAELEVGSEFVILDSSQNYYAFNFLYGRELELAKWFKIEGHAGLGLYHHDGLIQGDRIRRDALGVPVHLKFMFYPGKYFALGIHPEVNFNSINTTYIGNIVFQFTFH